MRILFLTLLAIYSFGLNAQNLVPNPGFDILTDCPNEFGQIYLATPWVSVSQKSPALFNTCSEIDKLSPPTAGHSYYGYQVQKSGEGYAGIFVYNDSNIIGLEYMGTPLKKRLEKGTLYYLEFYVSPDLNPNQNWIYTDAVGLSLTDSFYYESIQPNEAMSLEPVIENRGTLITDTVGWTRINGSYTAKGSEQFAIIGNFRSTFETLIEVEDSNITPYNNNFFVEDVLITPFDPLPDTLLLCEGEEKAFNASFLDAEYLWSEGSTDSILLISKAGKYSIEAKIDDCFLRDTVVVISEKDFNYFSEDTTVCRKDNFVLRTPIPGNYEWSTGSINSYLPIETSGNYWLNISNECGEFDFSYNVEVIDCNCTVLVPTAFSPNGDGINDNLKVFSNCNFDMQINKFTVFDRWGNLVFSGNGSNEIIWNANQGSNSLPIGVYIWYLEYEYYESDEVTKVAESGNVTLVR